MKALGRLSKVSLVVCDEFKTERRKKKGRYRKRVGTDKGIDVAIYYNKLEYTFILFG